MESLNMGVVVVVVVMVMTTTSGYVSERLKVNK
jgi:hypothetical protein